MAIASPARAPRACPFLAPVVADRLWILPVGAYCRRPDGRVRLPGEATLARLCSTDAHRGCAGYRVGVGMTRDAGSRGAGRAAGRRAAPTEGARS
jgi:hypothetical protein